MIPAMTSILEQHCFYELAKAHNQHGFVLELGTWLGAGTVAIAKGIQDSKYPRKAHVYDRFVWIPRLHAGKATLRRTMYEDFCDNVAELMDYIVVHKGDIEDMTWDKGPISLVIFDAPKRIKTISPVLTTIAPFIQKGTILVWQDFTHSVSCEIPLTISHLDVEFVKAVPGSTGVFRVRKPWTREDVTPQALSSMARADYMWDAWLPLLPTKMAENLSIAKTILDGR